MLEIEPSSESFEEVEEVDSRCTWTGFGDAMGEGRMEEMEAGSMTMETTGEVRGV